MSNNEFLDEEKFLQWFVGFTDAEGSFMMSMPKGTKQVYFSFKIKLHLDDINVLYLLKID